MREWLIRDAERIAAEWLTDFEQQLGHAPDHEDFLAGPHHLDLDIDEIFAANRTSVLRDICEAAGLDRRGSEGELSQRIALQAVEHDMPILRKDGAVVYSLRESDGLVIAQVLVARGREEDPLETAGVYFGSCLHVASEWRGKGYGTDLVAAQLIDQGGLMVWELDEAAYTPGGQATHVAAFDLLLEMVARYEPPADDPQP